MDSTDATTTLAELRQLVRTFVDQRDWQQFHAPKNISMAMAIEVAELMEHFQWISVQESRQLSAGSGDELGAVSEELADVLCYVLALANELDIDLTQAFRRKMRKNEEKYPADSYQGRYK